MSVKFDEILREKKFKQSFPDDYFHQIDRDLKRLYFWKSPYRISKQFLEYMGEKDVYQYGETPLETMDLIARTARLTPEDVVFELGSGRGRTAFFLHHFYGCRVKAFERIGLFVRKAKQIAKRYALNVHFSRKDFLNASFKQATFIYLYGTCLGDEIIYKLVDRLDTDALIATVSYPLSDYNSRFQVEKKITAKYPWGETEVYFQRWQKK